MLYMISSDAGDKQASLWPNTVLPNRLRAPDPPQATLSLAMYTTAVGVIPEA